MNDNYLVLNGKKITLTKEQLETLGIIEKDYNPFDRVAVGCEYYFVGMFGDVAKYTQQDDFEDESLFNSHNYFNDASVAQQVALHQLLYRKLLKFAYDNNCVDTAEWNGGNTHWTIRYNDILNIFVAYIQTGCKAPDVYFSSEAATRRAIKEIVEPFVKEHPDFVW